MKKIIISIVSVATIAALTFTSCKKKSDEVPPSTASDQVAHSSDENMFSDAANEILTSVNDGLNQKNAARIEAAPADSVANATVTLTNDTLYIHFNGTNAEGTRTRTGKVKVYLLTSDRWFTKGAKWKIDFLSGITITRKVDGKSVKLTGSKTITNVTGGNFKSLTSATGQDSVTHKIEGNVGLLFDNETNSRNWSVFRTRTIKKDGTAYKVIFTGFGTDGANSNVAESGTNRFGTAFTTTIDKPLVIQFCNNRYKFVSGVITHRKMAKDFTLTYGVDINGNVVTSNPCSSVAYKINYINAAGTNFTVIRSY